MKMKNYSNKKGFILPVLIIVIVFAAIATMGITVFTVERLRQTSVERDRAKALYAARAGVHRALYEYINHNDDESLFTDNLEWFDKNEWSANMSIELLDWDNAYSIGDSSFILVAGNVATEENPDPGAESDIDINIEETVLDYQEPTLIPFNPFRENYFEPIKITNTSDSIITIDQIWIDWNGMYSPITRLRHIYYTPLDSNGNHTGSSITVWDGLAFSPFNIGITANLNQTISINPGESIDLGLHFRGNLRPPRRLRLRIIAGSDSNGVEMIPDGSGGYSGEEFTEEGPNDPFYWSVGKKRGSDIVEKIFFVIPDPEE